MKPSKEQRAEYHARVQEKLAFLKWLTISHRVHIAMVAEIGDQMQAVSRDIADLRRVSKGTEGGK